MRAVANRAGDDSRERQPACGRLQVVASRGLMDTRSSYLACMPSAFDGLVQVSMDGTPGVYTELRWGFEVDALQVRRGLMLALAGWNAALGHELDHSEVSP